MYFNQPGFSQDFLSKMKSPCTTDRCWRRHKLAFSEARMTLGAPFRPLAAPELAPCFGMTCPGFVTPTRCIFFIFSSVQNSLCTKVVVAKSDWAVDKLLQLFSVQGPQDSVSSPLLCLCSSALPRQWSGTSGCSMALTGVHVKHMLQATWFWFFKSHHVSWQLPPHWRHP